MANTTPVFQTSLLLGPVGIALGARGRAVYDLTDSYGAYILARIGRGGTTGLTTGVNVRVNRLVSYTVNGSPLPYSALSGTLVLPHPAAISSQVGGTAAAARTTIDANVSAGATQIFVASTTGFAAGDVITLDGETGYDRGEVNRVLTVFDATTLNLFSPRIFAHTLAQADPVLNKADVWEIPVDGGSWIEVIVDHGVSTTGETVDAEVFVHEYVKDQTL